MSEAQLLAVHELLDKEEREEEEQSRRTQEAGLAGEAEAPSSKAPDKDAAARSSSTPVITMDHLRRALAQTRPSLPASERRRLAAIYARFQQTRSSSSASAASSSRTPEEEVGEGQPRKRATLA